MTQIRAIHRIALPKKAGSAADTKYAEPGALFSVDSKTTEQLLKSGAAVRYTPPEDEAPAKKLTKAEIAAAKKVADKEAGDLV